MIVLGGAEGHPDRPDELINRKDVLDLGLEIVGLLGGLNGGETKAGDGGGQNDAQIQNGLAHEG